MIVAGANAGVYDLKTMAFESMECFLRAGECFLSFPFLLLLPCFIIFLLFHPSLRDRKAKLLSQSQLFCIKRTRASTDSVGFAFASCDRMHTRLNILHAGFPRLAIIDLSSR